MTDMKPVLVRFKDGKYGLRVKTRVVVPGVQEPIIEHRFLSEVGAVWFSEPEKVVVSCRMTKPEAQKILKHWGDQGEEV